MSKMKIRFFTIADYEEEEIWLREQHKNGLRLVNTIIPCFYFFEECAPEDVVYRLDYKNYMQSGDYMQMARDFGWEYFNSCMGWLFFRKPVSRMEQGQEEEIFSDGASKVEMIRHIVRTRMLPIFILFLACVLPDAYRILKGDWWFQGEAVLGALYVTLLAIYLYLIVYCGRKLRKLRRRFEEETPYRN